MPKAARPPRVTFQTYLHVLDVLTESAMVVVKRVEQQWRPEGEAAPPIMDFGTITRTVLVISAIVRRAIVVSRYLETLPMQPEEREHRLGPALDRVLRLFANRKTTVEDYDRAIDAEIDGEGDDERDDHLGWDEREPDPEADVAGRPPAALVAELCRDFGMLARSLPPEWLAPLPTELRLLCARAAAAAIRPRRPAGRVGRTLQH